MISNDLREIRIKNLKSHKDTKIDVGKITILTGVNGVGKSSIFQSLLLLRQTSNKNLLHRTLELKGDLCDLGTAYSALYQSAEENKIEINLQTKSGEFFPFSYDFDENKPRSTSLKINNFSNFSVENLSLFNNKFQYISASRNGPNTIYSRDTTLVEYLGQISYREGMCELTPHFLDFYGDKDISISALKHSSASSNNIFENTQAWMSEISSGIRIIIRESSESYDMRFQFSRGEYRSLTEEFTPKNIGFGISYVLPIVAAILHAEPGALILIENPEAHIHPAGQAKMMQLLTLAAEHGIQIIIETHSDHIINGLLVASKIRNFEDDDLSLYYFDRDEESHSTDAKKLEINSNHQVKNPPRGFFDQINIDLEKLFGF